MAPPKPCPQELQERIVETMLSSDFFNNPRTMSSVVQEVLKATKAYEHATQISSFVKKLTSKPATRIPSLAGKDAYEKLWASQSKRSPNDARVSARVTGSTADVAKKSRGTPKKDSAAGVVANRTTNAPVSTGQSLKKSCSPELKNLILKTMVDLDFFNKPNQNALVIQKVLQETRAHEYEKQIFHFINAARREDKYPIRSLAKNPHYIKLWASRGKGSGNGAAGRSAALHSKKNSDVIKTVVKKTIQKKKKEQTPTVAPTDLQKYIEEQLNKMLAEKLPKIVEDAVAALLPTLRLETDIGSVRILNASSEVNDADEHLQPPMDEGEDDAEEIQTVTLPFAEVLTQKIDDVLDTVSEARSMIEQLSQKLESQEAARNGEKPVVIEQELSPAMIKAEPTEA